MEVLCALAASPAAMNSSARSRESIPLSRGARFRLQVRDRDLQLTVSDPDGACEAFQDAESPFDRTANSGPVQFQQCRTKGCDDDLCEWPVCADLEEIGYGTMFFGDASHFIEEHRLPHTAETDEHETPGGPAQPVPLDCNISRGEDAVAPGEFRGRGASARRIGVL